MIGPLIAYEFILVKVSLCKSQAETAQKCNVLKINNAFNETF